jgi:hypothetical protein
MLNTQLFFTQGCATMNDENLVINDSKVGELKQDYPQEMEIILKMLTEVSEGDHLEATQLKALVAL